MARSLDQAGGLPSFLRGLRESHWPELNSLTQAQVATALSSEGSTVASPTVSSWENLTNPKTPPAARISAYARFFSTKRSLEGGPHLIPEAELTQTEQEAYKALKDELFGLLRPTEPRVQRSFQFEAGPIVAICPDLPKDKRGPLADERDPNFTRMQLYGDLDALIELHGHLRAENPALKVLHRTASEVKSEDLSSHVILLGGIGWNKVTRRFQSAIDQVPITQEAVGDLKDGDIFQVEDSDGPQSFYPDYEDMGDGKELLADVGYLARLRNPFKVSHTLTICNGIFSHGVFGAVRCLTDASVREENERYLAERFPEGEFAMLLRVPVVANETLSPDLQNPDARLYEWAPNGMASRE